MQTNFRRFVYGEGINNTRNIETKMFRLVVSRSNCYYNEDKGR